jgi:peptidoglycan/xylan/chitin deacetylase (PgdA/CDA1 family)
LRGSLQPTPLLRGGAGRVFERRARGSDRAMGLVLMYHEIAPVQGDPVRDFLPALGADLFRAQLEHVRDQYEVVALRDLPARARERAAGERLPLAITFDDDLSRHRTVAAPLLEEFGYTATFFLTGTSLESPFNFWWQDLQVIVDRGPDAWPKLQRELAQTWSWGKIDGRRSDLTNTIEAAPPDLRDAIAAKLRELAGGEIRDEGLPAEAVSDMARRGFEIGWHTRRHYRMETLDGDRLDKEMRDGLEELSDVLGYRPTSVAYPHAKADLRIADAARRADFELGFVVGDTATGPDQHPLLLARVGGSGDSPGTFKWVLGRAARST